MKSAAQILRAAKALIDTPEKWGKGVGGILGGPCCGFIALMRVTNRAEAIRDKYLLPGLPGYKDFSIFNDRRSTTHADVMAAFDKAIALAERDELREAREGIERSLHRSRSRRDNQRGHGCR